MTSIYNRTNAAGEKMYMVFAGTTPTPAQIADPANYHTEAEWDAMLAETRAACDESTGPFSMKGSADIWAKWNRTTVKAAEASAKTEFTPADIAEIYAKWNARKAG